MSPFIYLGLMIFVFLCLTLHQFYRARRIRINNQILFSFCDLRRELMGLVKNGKVDVHDPSFKVYYFAMSSLIYYIRDYKFLSDYFLKLLCDGEMANKATVIELSPSVGPMIHISKKFYSTMDKAIRLADYWFVVKYQFILGGHRRKEYKRQKKEFKNNYEKFFLKVA